jgi:regulator of protease activity HflC (stomatin/prohibitin superfamily)
MQIDASVYYKIVDAQKSVYLVENIHDSVRYHTFASIRNVVG